MNIPKCIRIVLECITVLDLRGIFSDDQKYIMECKDGINYDEFLTEVRTISSTVFLPFFAISG